jgi:hypothetical protein
MVEAATIGLTTYDGNGSMHVRAWQVPADWPADFAAKMTVLFGEPDEMVSDVASMTAAGERAAAEGRATYLLHGEQGGGNG